MVLDAEKKVKAKAKAVKPKPKSETSPKAGKGAAKAGKAATKTKAAKAEKPKKAKAKKPAQEKVAPAAVTYERDALFGGLYTYYDPHVTEGDNVVLRQPEVAFENSAAPADLKISAPMPAPELSEGAAFPAKANVPTSKKAKHVSLNRELTFIDALYPLFCKESDFLAKKVVSSKKEAKRFESKSLPASKAIGQGFVSADVSVMRRVAQAKLLFLQGSGKDVLAQRTNGQHLAFCFGGHWVKKGDITGAPAVPHDVLYTRFTKMGKALPRVFKVFSKAKAKPSLLGCNLVSADAANVLPLCSECAGASHGVLGMALQSPHYGEAFFQAAGPFTHDVVARTSDGRGIADAMMSWWFREGLVATPASLLDPEAQEPVDHEQVEGVLQALGVAAELSNPSLELLMDTFRKSNVPGYDDALLRVLELLVRKLSAEKVEEREVDGGAEGGDVGHEELEEEVEEVEEMEEDEEEEEEEDEEEEEEEDEDDEDDDDDDATDEHDDGAF